MFCGGMDLRMTAQGDAQDLRAFLYKFYMETIPAHRSRSAGRR
jgi:hypothetical protein